ncbi:MAG: HAD-IA family hydrolase, partial [Actinomycetota bacterium]
MLLHAVIFDVDGTIAETEREGHRVAFNLAFERFGLSDVWDEELYGRLLAIHGGKPRLDHYLASRRMDAAERTRLVPALHEEKNRLFVELVRQRRIPLRPGILRLLDELAEHGVEGAIATTGSRSWVDELLRALLGPERQERFAAIVTGEDVSRLKPDPEIYSLALARLGCEAGAALAMEDSEPGLAAAGAAGLPCLVVRNAYTCGQSFAAA